MQTTDGYALWKLKESPEVLVTRVIQHMISMKKKKQQRQDFLVTREAKLRSIATPNQPPPPTHPPPPPAPPPPNMSTYPHIIYLSFGVCSKVEEHFWVYKILSQWWANFYLPVHDTPPPSTSPLSPPTPDLKAGQGRSHYTFQLPGTLVEEKAIQKVDSTIKAI